MVAFIIALIVSLEADFTQTKTVALMSEPQVSQGHLIYRAPDYMQWAYTEPQQLVWEVDGQNSNVNPQIQKIELSSAGISVQRIVSRSSSRSGSGSNRSHPPQNE